MGRYKKRRDVNHQDRIMAKNLDAMRELEEYKEDILPKIRKMLKAGKKAPEIRAFTQAYLTARQATIALTSENELAALKAIDALTHQHEGRPKERSEAVHRFEKLKEQELDALLESRLTEIQEGDEKPSSSDH